MIPEAPIKLDKYFFAYVRDQLKDASPDKIVGWYVQHLVFKNEGYLEYLIKEYKLPKTDILKIHSKMVSLA